jgi:transcriptional regulator with XRE-family HTH domain
MITFKYGPGTTGRNPDMGFASTLRRLREAAGLSQADLARVAGVPARSIQNWEQGRVQPRLAVLAKLAAALGVDVAELLVADDRPDARRPRGRPAKPKDEKPKPKRPRKKGG